MKPVLNLRFTVPAQAVTEPVKTAVGKGLTVTTAVPLNVPVQLALLTAVKEYVFVDAGLTLMVYGLAAIPVMVLGVVPSV